MHGVLVVDKPRGPTSFDVVAIVRRALGEKRVGHTGTLDPMATGVLPVCLGEATRIVQFLQEGDKAYEAVLKLGEETDTLDADGQVVARAPVPPLTAERVEAALAAFRGTYPQVPPMYSAVKVDGKRLYELARAGEEVERAARTVTVHELQALDFQADTLRIAVRCSKGFFVRVLGQDLGRALGCGAHLVSLRRTMTGGFGLEQAVPLDEVKRLGPALAERLVSEAEALRGVPAVTVDAAAARRVLHGGVVEVAREPGLVRVLGPAGELLALADVVNGRLKYRRVLAREA